MDIKKDWIEKGVVKIPFFSKAETEVFRKEAIRLLEERDSNWKENGIEGSKPYMHPNKVSKVFYDLMLDNRLVEYSRRFISFDTNIPFEDVKLQASQTWIYFKPPGELGRDVHQNIFYTHCDWGHVINISLSIDASDSENGGMYWYFGSHKEKVCYPIPDDLKDYERMKTNPKGWSNERGKPIFIPGTYKNGKWVDKYDKTYMETDEGDVTFVHSHVLHGSDENKAKDRWRMSFLVGYVLKDSFMNVGKEIKRERIDIE